MSAQPAGAAPEGAWRHAVDSPLPQSLRVGGGSALFVSGWVFHRGAPVEAVALRLGAAEHTVAIHSMPRLDVYVALAEPGDRPPTTAYRSGFWAVVPVPGVTEPTEVSLALGAVNEDGERYQAEIASLTLLPSTAPAAADPEPGLVAICMTSFNPDLELFRRQVASIRSQTHERWHCVVSDDGSEPETLAAIERELKGDARFELHRSGGRLGFYFNFERALELAPAHAEAVALCDQDDEWRPDKLARLLAELRRGHTLVYSDQRIVSPAGEVLAPSYWVGRENQWSDLRALALANTVTGAASLLRRDLLDVVLPFPPRLAGAYHDHWLALAALACGTIGFVDEPLYDYVQHAGQVLGHPAGKHGAPVEAPPVPRLGREHESLIRWQLAYFAHVVPPQFAAAVLLERCGSRLRPDDRATLEALADGDSSRRGMLTHARAAATLRRESLGTLGAMAWRRWSRWRARPSAVPYADHRHSLDSRPEYVEYGPEPAQKGSAPGRGKRRWRAK